MSPKDDFASLMEAAGSAPIHRVHRGDTVEGTVVALGQDTIFVDVGSGSDIRLDRAECVDETGQLRLHVGDRVRGVVVEMGGPEGPRMSITMGHGSLGRDALESALEAGVAVEGTVKASNKGGLEVQVGGVRGFCPASQVELGRADDLESYVGRALRFKILELKNDGSVVLSRRQLLEEERLEEGRRALESLSVGAELEGTVTTVQRYGAFVDLGGVEGLVHISELSGGRVARVEDVVSPGDRVRVRVVSLEQGDKHPRIGLSIKALAPESTANAPAAGEVLEAEVTELAPFGVFVETAKGSGLVPTRELELGPGADHRRGYPAGTKIRVVLKNLDERTGRRTFSMKRVADAEERKNFAEYATAAARSSSGKRQVGTFGALLAEKLGIPEPKETEPEPTPSRRGPPEDERAQQASVERDQAPRDTPRAPARKPRPDPPGVIRRKRAPLRDD